MTKAMQVAAVKAAVNEGKSLDDIEKHHPELADGVKTVREESVDASPAPRHSGSIEAHSSMTRPPTL